MFRSIFFGGLILSLALCACADDEQPDSPVYPLDHLLRLNHLQVKGTHNSYHLDPGFNVKPWEYDHQPLNRQLGQQGAPAGAGHLLGPPAQGLPRLSRTHGGSEEHLQPAVRLLRGDQKMVRTTPTTNSTCGSG